MKTLLSLVSFILVGGAVFFLGLAVSSLFVDGLSLTAYPTTAFGTPGAIAASLVSALLGFGAGMWAVVNVPPFVADLLDGDDDDYAGY